MAASFGCEAAQNLVVGAWGRKLNKIKRMVCGCRNDDYLLRSLAMSQKKEPVLTQAWWCGVCSASEH
jgi:hypothetical protein